MFGYKLKIEDDLLEKLQKCSEMAGYASVDEFIIHALEKETAAILGADSSSASEEEIKKRLRGLGYIE
jgi:predicted CopG family antitoxin